MFQSHPARRNSQKWIPIFGLLPLAGITFLLFTTAQAEPPTPPPGTAGFTAAINNHAAAVNSLTGAANNLASQVSVAAPALSSSINQLATASSQISNSIDGTSSQAGALSDAWLAQTEDFLSFGNQFLEMAGSYQTLAQDLSSAWGSRVDDFNQSFETLAGGIAALSDPQRMALVAAASGFAGTIASGIASALPSLIWKGAEGIAEAITQQKADSIDHQMVRALLGNAGTPGAYDSVQARVRELSKLVQSATELLQISQRPKSKSTISRQSMGDLSGELAQLQVEKDIQESAYRKAIEAEDRTCALTSRQEANRLDQKIAGLTDIMEAVDTLSMRSTQDMGREICESLSPAWGSLAQAEGELQYLRGQILKSQTGFFREEVKRRMKSSKGDFKAARRTLAQDAEARNDDPYYFSELRKLWLKMHKDSLKDLAQASQMTSYDLEKRIGDCIVQKSEELKRSFDYADVQECKRSVLSLLAKGDYATEKTERWAQYFTFDESMRDLMSTQESIFMELRPENEAIQAMMLAYAEDFTQVAKDQVKSESQLKELSQMEGRFAQLCQGLNIPDWDYTQKFLVGVTRHTEPGMPISAEK